jgi:catechol 2,3-dioxygenase-like lactoylglutathione lyase family enzyme
VRGGPLSIRGAYLRAGSASVEIHQYSPSRAGERETSDLGFGHLSFAVNDIGRACEHLRTQGMSFYTEPNFIDSGAMDGRWWVYGEDPWGNVIEIAQPSSA